ncbi:MAG TPA: hypothetical protein VG407_00175 [Caulobacteraceae bacterium]|jgi:hypothetical protein|nr:hypothetical protein [Caulobacteraceae bacterium]
MRALFVIILIAAALFVGGWWLMGQHHGRAYAPKEAQDTDLSVQPANEPNPPVTPTPSEFRSDPNATLPSGPIPYDKLDKARDPALAASDPNAPPEKKSNDKAIFY